MSSCLASTPHAATTTAPGADTAPPVDAIPIRSLSPSRAGDFKTCPLLYRFRVIDRLPQRPSPDAVRGTVVHAVLERLYDLPAADRTPAAAAAMVDPEWRRLAADQPELGELMPAGEIGAWLESARSLVEGYFGLENPTRLEPAERELYVETELDDGLILRGYVDRLDVAPSGELRVIDYKTGGAPRAAFEGKALFQMKFYALVLWRLRGRVPTMLRLIYLKDHDTLTYEPGEAELIRFEATLRAIWSAISRAAETGDFRPSPGPLCGWCDFQALCPAYGGTPPPYPSRIPADSDSPEPAGSGATASPTAGALAD